MRDRQCGPPTRAPDRPPDHRTSAAATSPSLCPGRCRSRSVRAPGSARSSPWELLLCTVRKKLAARRCAERRVPGRWRENRDRYRVANMTPSGERRGCNATSHRYGAQEQRDDHGQPTGPGGRPRARFRLRPAPVAPDDPAARTRLHRGAVRPRRSGRSDATAWDSQRYSRMETYAEDVVDLCRSLDLGRCSSSATR